VGRLAHYKYYNMDAAMEAALNMTDAFLTRMAESIAPTRQAESAL